MSRGRPKNDVLSDSSGGIVLNYNDLVKMTRRALRRQRLRDGLSTLVLIFLVLFGLSGIAGAVALSKGSLAIFVTCALVFIVACLLRYLVCPLFVKIPDSRILKFLETDYPAFKGRLSLANYLETQSEETALLGYSAELISETLGYAKNLPDDTRVPKPPERMSRDWRKWFWLLLLADVLFFSFQPAGFLAGWRSLSGVFQQETPASKLISLQVKAPEYAARGSRVKVLASAVGIQDEAPVFHRKVDDEWKSAVMKKVGRKLFSWEMQKLSRSTAIRVSAGQTVSEQHVIRALDRPRVEAFSFTYHYPEYTGLAGNRERRIDGNIVAPKGTEVEIQIETNNALSSAELFFDEENKILLDISALRVASVSLTVRESTRYQVRLEDTFGLTLEEGPYYQIISTPDSSPSVSIISPAIQVIDIPEEMKVALSGQSEDDYGLASTELVYQVGYDRTERTIQLEHQPLTSGDGTTGSNIVSADVRLEWDLRALDLLPGEEINYWLRTFDNDPVDGPKEGVSNIQVIRFPSMFEIYEEVQEKESAQVDSVEDILNKQRDLQGQTRELRDALRSEDKTPNAEVPWEHKETLEELRSRQEDIQKEMKDLQEEYEQSLEQMREDSAVSLQTLEKMAKIQELMDKMMTQEMKDTLGRFNQALEKMALREMDKSLGNLDFSMEKLEQNLDRTLSLLQQSYVERRLERLAHQASELAKSHQELLERTERRKDGTPMDDLARKEQQLREAAEQFIEDASSLMKESETVKPELSEQLEDMIEKAREEKLEESMKTAEESLSKGDQQQALTAEQKAQTTLDEMSASLSETKESMMGMSIVFDLKEWHRLMDRAFYLSEQQEAFNEGLPSGLGTNLYSQLRLPLNDRAVTQSLFAAEADRIAAEVETLAAQNPFIDMDVADLLESAGDSLRRWALESKDSYGFLLKEQSRESLSLVNMSLAKMLEVLEEMLSMAASSSMEGFREMLEQIIQQQQDINDMTQRLDGQNRERPEWAEQLQRMIQQQQMVRQMMEEMRQKYEHVREILGDLSELGKQMKDIEETLKGEETGEAVQEKQTRLLQRLLDAEKSLREEEDNRRRKSETAEEYEPGMQLPEDSKAHLRKKVLENKARLNRERIFPEYREVLKNYFQRLSEEAF